jgi:hypothetical protein
VIREELRKFLKAHEETFGEFLAGESLRNPGVTIIYPKDKPAAMPPGMGGGISSLRQQRPFHKPR